jgi:uncharacterized protein YaiI (UPF0178 family)
MRDAWCVVRFDACARRLILDLPTDVIPGSLPLRIGTRYSVLGTRYSVLGTRYSVLGTRYSVLGTRYSVLRSWLTGVALKIWIDADAAPREVKDLVFRAAKRLNIPTILVANQRLQPPAGNPLVTAVWVDGGPDVADQHIATAAEPGDLVVTQDVPLAAVLVPRGVVVLDPRGEEHTSETIGERLSIRDFMERARLAGAVTGGPPPYDGKSRQAFAVALDRALTRLSRQG